MCIWGYSPVGLATNTARDLGTRLAVMVIWGTPAAGGPYAAIAALTNIPATVLAAAFHEFILADSSRGMFPVSALSAKSDQICVVITPPHVDFMVGHLAHAEHSGLGAPRTSPVLERKQQPAQGASPSMTYNSDEKAEIEVIERV